MLTLILAGFGVFCVALGAFRTWQTDKVRKKWG